MADVCPAGSWGGVDRSPGAVGCDPADTSAVVLSLANFMFDECDSACLYDVRGPGNTAWSWLRTRMNNME